MCTPSEGPIALADFAKTFAETICAQQEACGCEVDFGCAGVLAQSFQLIADVAAQHSLQYDAACAGEFLAFAVTDKGCAVRSEFYDNQDCWNGCQIFQGEVPTGGACPSEDNVTFYPFIKSCAVAEERCIYPDNVCGVYEPVILPKDADCFSPMEGPLGDCEEGTSCNYDTYKCAATASEGESCTDGVVCDDLSWCDEQFVCRAPKGAGEPCTSWVQCESYRCDEGACSDTVVVCEVDDFEDIVRLPI